jgi:hypothetical protein
MQHESGIGMQDAFCLRLNLRHLRRVAPPAPRLLAALGELLGTAVLKQATSPSKPAFETGHQPPAKGMQDAGCRMQDAGLG